MIDYTKDWDSRIIGIEKRLNNIDIKLVYEFEKERLQSIYDGLNRVSAILGMPKEDVKKWISPGNIIFDIEEAELTERYNYYTDIFGNDLITILNNENGCTNSRHYNGIFSYKNKELIKYKVDALKEIFKIDIKGVVRLVSNSSLYIFMNPNTILDLIKYWGNYFKLSYEQIIEILIIHPKTISLTPELISKRIQVLLDRSNRSVDDIKKAFVSYPPLFFMFPTAFDRFLRFNAYRTKEVYDEIINYPWVVDCYKPDYYDIKYCGFNTLGDLLSLAETIEKKYGSIIKVEKTFFSDHSLSITHLFVKSDNTYYLISFQNRCKKSFFEGLYHYIAVSIQIITKEDVINSKDIISATYHVAGKGVFGYYLDDGMCIVEAPIKYLNELLAKDMTFVADEKINLEFYYNIILDEEKTQWHKELMDDMYLGD